LVATSPFLDLVDAPASCRGDSRWLLLRLSWIWWMPRPRAGEIHVGCYNRPPSRASRCPALGWRHSHADSSTGRRSALAQRNNRNFDAIASDAGGCSGQRESPRHKAGASIREALLGSTCVNLPGTRPGHPFEKRCWVAANVNLPGIRPGHPTVKSRRGSRQRESPRHKAGASDKSKAGGVAADTGVPYLIGIVPILGILFVLCDVLSIFGETRRCIHDAMARTKVVTA
jgi:hypothetical protein